MTTRTDRDIAAIVEAVAAYFHHRDGARLRDALEVEEEATWPEAVGDGFRAVRCACCGRMISRETVAAFWSGDDGRPTISHAGPCVPDDRIITRRFPHTTSSTPARVIGAWAMHKAVPDDESCTVWAITHVPSGFALSATPAERLIVTRPEAWSLVKALGEQCSSGDYCTPAPSRDSMSRVRAIVERVLGRPLRADSASVGVGG